MNIFRDLGSGNEFFFDTTAKAEVTKEKKKEFGLL